MPKYKVTRITVTSHVIEKPNDSIRVAPWSGQPIEEREIWSVEKVEG